jgi:hypothetical protein
MIEWSKTAELKFAIAAPLVYFLGQSFAAVGLAPRCCRQQVSLVSTALPRLLATPRLKAGAAHE